MDIFTTAGNENGLTNEEINAALIKSMEGRDLKNVLILPPDITRFHSNAGYITNFLYHYLTEKGVNVDIIPTVGTHLPLTPEQAERMYGDIPFEKFIAHKFREDTVKLGEVPGEFINEVAEGIWNEPVSVEVSKYVMDPKYDLIVSPGQVVPHEVVGMANHAKNFFVGVGGADMINKIHIIAAIYGKEKMMGKEYTPIRKIFDYAFDKFLSQLPILFMLTVTTAPGGKIRTHGLFIGEGRECLTQAVKLSQEKNIDFVDHAIKKCVVYLDPSEFTTTWVGNKSVYRTTLAMADDGDLIILAPGVDRFGEDPENDRLIRKYGYFGTAATVKAMNENDDLKANLGAAAHLIHGTCDGRYRITYCVKEISQEEIRKVGYIAASYDEMIQKYNPEKLVPGYNTVDGEDIFYVPNPALGLWINRETFEG